MAWSFKIFTLAGVPVRLHVTFLLLLVWLAALFWMRAGPSAAAEGVLFILLLFGSVVLHEFGHVLAARRYGIATADVTLLPIGGVASIERIPEKPSQEIVIALAGPAVNVAIWIVLMLLADVPALTADAARLDDPGAATMLSRVASANLLLALFNMIPAFPMDGGRVLRALLATRFGFVRATRIAAGVGQALAVVFAFLGLFGSPLLVLIAIFVFLAASAEASAVEARQLARGYRACDAMITSFQSLGPAATAKEAADMLLRTTQQEFPVLEAGKLKGFVLRDGLITALREGPGDTPVTAFMTTDVPTVARTASLERVTHEFRMGKVRAVAVLDEGGRLSGYVTPENFGELLMVRGAIDQAATAAGGELAPSR
jgi:Zn-dependent protease/CBS domain-containing protein